MLTFLQLVLNLLLAAEFGLSSQNIIPFLAVAHLFVEFNDLAWNYPHVLYKPSLFQAVLIPPSPLCTSFKRTFLSSV